MQWYLLLFLLLSNYVVIAQERILSYDVDITLTSEDRIIVEEKIQVVAEGLQIKRGIYRTIPTIRTNDNGRREIAPVKIISVQRNGKEDDFTIQKSGNEATVYIGNKNHYLTPDIYTYTLIYETENQIGFFEDYDELYWNFIGHHWAFNIEKFSATLHLPDGAEYIQGACYVGFYGSDNQDCRIQNEDVRTVKVIGINTLIPGQGATLAIAWTKGYVEDSFTKKMNNHSVNIIIFIVGLTLLLILFYTWWSKVGVDPPVLPVVPDWHPPKGLSPAALHYIRNKYISNATISAALVNAAVKGAVKIDNTKRREFTFTKTDANITLHPEESVFLNTLFGSKKKFTLTTSTYDTYKKASLAFNSSLNTKVHLTDYFVYNSGYLFYGLLLTAFLMTVALGYDRPNISDISTFWIYVISFAVSFVGIFFVILPFQISNLFRYLVLAILLPVVAFFVWLTYDSFFYVFNKELYFAFIVIALFVGGLYGYLIGAPTVKGQETVAQIKGFRQYLTMTEQKMLDYFTPPQQTPEHFEKMLPYAIALGVQNKWARKFKNVLDQAIKSGEYSPTWYAGNYKNIHNISRSFQSSVSMSAPSSSGSGGGGFSGGGGGGGGGGGW